jgi:hypothetical protein
MPRKRAVKARLFTDLKRRIPGPEGQLGRLCRLRPLLRAALVERPPGLDRDLRRLRAGLPRPAAREGSFPRFYQSVKRWPSWIASDRHRILKALVPPVSSAPLMVQRSEAGPR